MAQREGPLDGISNHLRGAHATARIPICRVVSHCVEITHHEGFSPLHRIQCPIGGLEICDRTRAHTHTRTHSFQSCFENTRVSRLLELFKH